jgi:hypothetical protein
VLRDGGPGVLTPWPGIIGAMPAEEFELLEQSRLIELVAATDVPQLHRLLLLGPRSQMDLDELAAVTVLQHHHGDGQPGAFDTALLICTDRSWRHTTGPVIAWIEASGLLSVAELDELTELFLQPGPAQAERQVRPPLRRWAAARRLRARPGALTALQALAENLDPNSGAGVVQGICDGLDVLPDDMGAAVLATALRWPRANVRKLALERLIDRGEYERAYQLGSTDPDTGLRRWCERTRFRLTPGAGIPDDQLSLFDLEPRAGGQA